MKKLTAIIILFACPFPTIGFAQSTTHVGLTGGLGIPKGFLDITANSSVFLRKSLSPPVDAQMMLQSSFGTKEDPRGGGRLNILTNSAYLLGRINLLSSSSKVLPYLAVGGGLHYMYSWASSSSVMDDSNTEWSVKTHSFLGFDLPINPGLFVSAWGRATFPSDKILDLAYVGLGVRL